MMDFVLRSLGQRDHRSAPKLGWMLGKGEPWQPGEKLKLLFAGYNGTRNMGSDVRVEEMLRQIRHILGADNVDFSVMTQNFEFTDGYFEGTRQVHLPDIFPPFLVGRSSQASWRGGVRRLDVQEQVRERADHHDDRFARIAAAQNKLSVGYGAEAGHMDPLIAKMCARYCQNSLVITRNEESRTVLRELGRSH